MGIKNWPGGVIRKTPITPTGDFSTASASGMWKLEQVSSLTKQRLWPTAANKLYIEDVFSNWIYTGTGAAQTLTNGINLSGKGGLVWTKGLENGADHSFFDTERGPQLKLTSVTTAAQINQTTGLTGFNSTGYSFGTAMSTNGADYSSWTFRKQKKFFDIVTYTGDGTIPRAISHNLGSTPGFIIVKSTFPSTSQWACYHRSLGSDNRLLLSGSGGSAGTNCWGSSLGLYPPTENVFYVGTDSVQTNGDGVNYVAYLFAHNAGGFGDSGLEDVVSCGIYTGNGSGSAGPIVTLGWEPQWLLIKSASAASDYFAIFDNMRGLGAQGGAFSPNLYAGTTAPSSQGNFVNTLPNGFQLNSTFGTVNTVGVTYVYVAIRRGPMKKPTLGTSVFTPITYTGTGATQNVSAGFPIDLAMSGPRLIVTSGKCGTWDRLRGTFAMYTLNNNAETDTSGTIVQTNPFNSMTSFKITGTNGQTNTLNSTYVNWAFRRAPGFFDIISYTGTGSNGLTVNHNLGVVPELTILKSRDGAREWEINYDFTSTQCKRLQLTTTNASTGNYGTSGISHFAQPTATQLSLTGSVNAPNTNTNTEKCIGYLFASCPGVSKVGTYTGTGTTLQIDCGFSSSARFVLIKRTDPDGSPRNWYVWDSGRGIVSGDDPYLVLNSSAAEVTNTDYIDSYSSGFEISSTASSDINGSGGTFLYLAIA